MLNLNQPTMETPAQPAQAMQTPAQPAQPAQAMQTPAPAMQTPAPAQTTSVVENSGKKKLNSTEKWAKVEPLLVGANPELVGLLTSFYKPKSGTAKDWSRVIGIKVEGGKTHDIARECSITKLWHFVPVGAKSSQSPITSNRLSKALTDVVKKLTDKANEDFMNSINSGNIQEAQKYMAIATDNVDSEKDANGEVVRNKFEVIVDTLKSLYPNDYEALLNQNIELYKADGRIIGATKEEAKQALLNAGYDVNSLVLEG